MTWTKLSDDFTDQCASLSDAAFRSHVEALVWVMRKETGGYISDRDLTRLAESVNVDAAVLELVRVGWWTRDIGGYRVRHHIEHQPEPEVIAARRELASERQRRKRIKAAGLNPDDLYPRDDPRDDPRDPGRDGSGRDGDLKDQLRLEEEASA